MKHKPMGPCAMAVIDIRREPDIERINNIIFGAGDAQIEHDHSMDRINVYSISGDWIALDKEDIPFLIKAFEKAKELGWMDGQSD